MAWLGKHINARRDEKGAVLVLATAGVILATIAAALSVDLGRLAAEKRTDQKVADLAALDGARALPADPTAAVDASLTRNKFPLGTAGYSRLVEVGYLDASRTFVPDASRPEAVRVTVRSSIDNAFITGSHSVTAKAVAKQGTSLGTVRVGSTLVEASGTVPALGPPILNRLLNRVLGGSYSLDGVGWKGVADANVTFQNLRTALGMTAGSADTVLDTTFTFRQLLAATATALRADGSPSSATVATFLDTIGVQADAAGQIETPMELRDFFDIRGNVGNGQDVADATLNVLDLLRGGLILADGDHFVSMDMTAFDPGLSGIPGFQLATVKLGLIEAPQTASGAPKDASGTYLTSAETSQVRVLIEVTLRVDLVGLGLVDVKVPYYLSAGDAEALLDTLHCGGSTIPSKVDILGRTQAGTSSLATTTNASLGDPSAPPTLNVAQLVNVTVPLIGNVTISTTSVATTTIPGNPGVMLSFLPPYTASSPAQPVPGTAISLPTLTTGGVTVGGTGLLSLLDIAALEADLVAEVNAAAPGVTTNLLAPLYRSLGLGFAGADVWAPPPQTCSASSFTSPSPTPSAGIPALVG